MIVKTYQYRLYPTKTQEVLLAKTFGCVRYVYNRCLARKTKHYQQTQKGLSMYELSNEVTQWKQSEETVWLNEVNSQSLQSSLRNLDAAFTNFFKHRGKFPRFKSKRDNRQSFTNPQATKVDWESKCVFIPKFREGIKCVLHRKFEGKIKSSTVTKSPSGKYFISITVEEEGNYPSPTKPEEKTCLGIDLGLIDYATFSDGTKVKNPKHLKRRIKQLRRLSRKHSKKKKGSNNRNKSRVRLVRLHEQVANIRKDFLHKLTSTLVKNHDYDSFAIEDLSVSSMLKSSKTKNERRAISDASWFTFRQYLSYKCERNGKNLLVIGRFEPSSKMCTCGKINNHLTCKDRVWTCDSCNITHDRDILAANNIRRFAFCKQEYLPLDEREVKPVETSSDVLEAGILGIHSGE